MSTRRRSGGLLRAALVAVLAFVLATVYSTHALAAGPNSGTGAAGQVNPASKIDSAVTKSLTQAGFVTFFVELATQANLNSVSSTGRAGTQRTADVFAALTSHADQTQAGLRELLTARGVEFTPFWIANTIKVTGDGALVDEIATRPEVKQILPERFYPVPELTPAQEQAQINAVEWNIDRVRANKVWSDFSVRGENVVVANIDTGVQYTHPALVGKYRGNKGDGTFDHNYNWHDPSRVCGNPSLAPCDNNNHGSHTMGTMVGDDGGANQIGVAPNAKWIAAKGCEASSCSDTALLSSGQFIVAPTDLNGQNPRPDLAPDIVNNSWGGGGGNQWYLPTVNAWVAAGIFPAFSNGNSGALGCNSSGSPGDYAVSYSAGAFDVNNAIASFSSRGPGSGGIIKPNISAPGVAVRSSIANGSYGAISGTSMASPHVAGAVALIWSASPALAGDVNATKALLNQTAVDTPSTQCGGTPENNNVWGEGKLDAFISVEAAPRGPTGAIAGTVVSAGKPADGVKIEISGPTSIVRTTGADGKFSLDRAPVGSYTVKASKFGLVTKEVKVVVEEGKTASADFDLPAAPSFTIKGTVKAPDGSALGAAEVSLANTPVAAVKTDPAGAYTLSVPAGTYEVVADYGRWLQPGRKSVNVSGNVTADFGLEAKVDAYGYTPRHATPSWVDTSTALSLTGDNASANVNLPFPVTFYGKTYKTAAVHTDGYLAFAGVGAPGGAIPAPATPNGAIYAFWDDLVVDAQASVRTHTDGAAPNRRFIVEWRNVTVKSAPGSRLSAELILTEGGRLQLQYQGIDPSNPAEAGAGATVGLENETGTVALPYSVKKAHLADGTAISARVPNTGLVRGTITDANDKQPIAGGSVALQRAGKTVNAVSDSTGFFQAEVTLGSFTVVTSQRGYESDRANLTIGSEGVLLTKDFALRSSSFEVNPTALEVVVPAGETRKRTVTVRNSGSATGNWELKEVSGGVLEDPGTAAKGLAAKAKAQGVKNYDPNGRTSVGLDTADVSKAAAPDAPGNVLKTFPLNELTKGWGAGFSSGKVWISDVSATISGSIANYGTEGTFGATFPSNLGGWPGDLAFVPGRNLVCQVTVGGDNGIKCLNPDTGALVASITGSPWGAISQRGLAYRADDDTFYIGGWNEGVIYKVKGLSYPDPGALVSSCRPGTGLTAISGLAWSPRGVLWAATNSGTDTIAALNPDTCAQVATVPDPDATTTFSGAGLELDETGNLWVISQSATGKSKASLVESPIPSFADVPWLSQSVAGGSLAAGAGQQVEITVDATNLKPGVHGATIFAITNAAKRSTISIPVKVIVPKTRISLDAGGNGGVDALGDSWSADQAYSTGGIGWLGQSSKPASTTEAISGTSEQSLYQTQREGAYEYRFDGLAKGVYQIELNYAELGWTDPNARLFDVIIEGKLVTPALDVAGEVGGFAALATSQFAQVDDGQLNVRFVSRAGAPIVNGVRVTERPDRATP
ncbi:S8 family serine peptidase [Kibdelosporangium philippinense]|uniref:S8 family serine peptidase n=1 Tax=Kibdelosporangium philippinense TaxID=211113 RepID=A0ABS8ZW14_9PSEU|nr:S8 family serine peptidase [Kibdelosporangium philippinense]MCE7011910.1 S8 family serine peptidase [Kibdelosporangium philippinense]